MSVRSYLEASVWLCLNGLRLSLGLEFLLFVCLRVWHIWEFWAFQNHVCGTELRHQNVKCCHFWELFSCIYLVQLDEFGQRRTIHIVPKMWKQSGRNSPRRPSLCDGTLTSLFGLLSVDYFVETCQHVPSSDMLECLSGLQEKAPVGYLHLQFLVVSEPYKKSRESRFAVDCQEGDIVVEACEDGSHFIFDEVRSGWGEQVSATLHLLGKGILLQTHSDGWHLSHLVNRINQFVAPVVHFWLPVFEILGNNLREIICSVFRSVPNLPHESPLGIKYWLDRTHRLIFGCIPLHPLPVFSSLLLEFGAHTDLVVVLGLGVIK